METFDEDRRPKDDDDDSASCQDAVLEISTTITLPPSEPLSSTTTETETPPSSSSSPSSQWTWCHRPPPSSSRLLFSFVLLGVVATILVLTFVVILENKFGTTAADAPWSDMTMHQCDEYCENSQICGNDNGNGRTNGTDNDITFMEERPLVQQPVNAWTNLAYIWVGLVPITVLRVDISTIMYLVASMLVGICSFMFHASLTIFWMNLDASYMYTYFSTLVCHGIHAVTGISWKWIVVPLLAWMIALPFIKSDMDRVNLGSGVVNLFQLCCICLLIAILALARIRIILRRPNMNTTAASSSSCCCTNSQLWAITRVVMVASAPGVIHAVAIVFWNLDMYKVWCDPDSSFQGHGVWHCLTALESLIVWLYFDRNHLAEILVQGSTSPPPTIIPPPPTAMKGEINSEKTENGAQFPSDLTEEI